MNLWFYRPRFIDTKRIPTASELSETETEISFQALQEWQVIVTEFEIPIVTIQGLEYSTKQSELRELWAWAILLQRLYYRTKTAGSNLINSQHNTKIMPWPNPRNHPTITKIWTNTSSAQWLEHITATAPWLGYHRAETTQMRKDRNRKLDLEAE